MAMSGRYHKPNMTNMPAELGKRVFLEILNSPVPDHAKLHEDSVRLEQQMISDMEKDESHDIEAE
ncbi:MAG: hypothetical protein IJG85_00185 [Eubacteriaceae bacterium]|nr:hypothetical protein [Eubacteriaceae bacterium]